MLRLRQCNCLLLAQQLNLGARETQLRVGDRVGGRSHRVFRLSAATAAMSLPSGSAADVVGWAAAAATRSSSPVSITIEAAGMEKRR